MHKPWLAFYEAAVPHRLAYPSLTLDALLRQSAQRYPDHTATTFVLSYLLGGRLRVGGQLTYRRLDALVDQMAAALYAQGVRKGDRVALMLPNSPQLLIAFFATLRIGALVVSVNPTYTSREMHELLTDSGAETLVLLNLFWGRLAEIRAQTPLKRVVVTHVFDLLPAPWKLLAGLKQRRDPRWHDIPNEPGVFAFESFLAQANSPAPPVDVSPDDTSLLQYTGGTTGTPKAAMLSHRNLVANVIQITGWLTDGQPGNEKVMSAIPFFHVYGTTVCMLYGVYMGYELVIVPDPRPIENVMHIIERTGCTLFPGVPAMYIAIVNHKNIDTYDLRSVRACISGSAPLPIEIQERFGVLTGGRLVEGFGLTEAAPVTHCNPVYGQRRAGSIGLPLPDVEARLVDTETGQDVPFDNHHTGELWVRGPQVMQGYWQRPDETAATKDAEGWLHTGDICRADQDGYFYIVDRKKDIINVSGYKVLPREVEEVLYTHPAVLEVSVVGVPHTTRGDDIVKAYVVPREGMQPSADELRAFCRQQLAPYKVPRVVELRATLPKSAVGKVLRRMLLAEEIERQAADRGAPPAHDEPAPA